jgi:PAS domain S-box-containing protein
MPEADVRKLAHELHVHQIELEMQNDELRSAQLELQKSRNKYSDLYEFAPCGYLSMDARGIITQSNLTFAALAGMERGRFIKTPFFLLIHQGDRNIFHGHLRAVLEHANRQFCELRLKIGRSKEFFFVRLDSILDSSQGNAFCRTTVTDITERKRVEEELIKAKEEAEKATKLKDQFMSLMAHDIKSPIICIAGFLKLVFKDEKHPVHPKHKKVLERVVESCIILENMVNELLELERLQTGNIALKFSFFDGRKVAATAFDKLSHQASEKGIELINDVPEGTRLYADLHLFEQVLLNLVSNAIKFCKEDDRIIFFIPADQRTTLALRDTGTGIDGSILPDLFRHEIKTSTYGNKGEKGTGLGLPHSHDIMKAHGGALAVESKPGEGSTFFARLTHVRPLVLVVDDESDIRWLIKNAIQSMDVDFMEAGNGKEAMEGMEHGTPHLIITDLRMDDMNGFDFIENIKKKTKASNIPIIVLTSDKDIKTRNKVFNMGADDFVTKPISMEDLLPRVRRFLP